MTSRYRRSGVARHAGGRPPSPPEVRRPIRTMILWTVAEAKEIEAALAAVNEPFPAWSRPILLEAARKAKLLAKPTAKRRARKKPKR